MTQKTKLEIIGPYTPEHEGPYAWILGYPKKCSVHSVVEGVAFITADGQAEPFSTRVCFIRNAREVPMSREFWAVINWDGKILSIHKSYTEAKLSDDYEFPLQEIAYFREVTEGDKS